MPSSALIIDDSRLACKVMANMLESFEIKSTSVYSARDGLELLKKQTPDVILLDHTMPEIDGFEALRCLKSNPLTETIPVLMYTAKEGEAYLAEARALGALDVLPKGLQHERLGAALDKLGLLKDSNQKPANYDKIPLSPSAASQSQTSVQQNLADPKAHYPQSRLVLEESINNQTRRLTREFHQTLEQFEHALAHRLRSQDDFNQARADEVRGTENRWRIVASLLFLSLLASLLFQQWQMNQLNLDLLKSQEKLADALQQQSQHINQVEQKLAQLTFSNPGDGSGATADPLEQTPNQPLDTYRTFSLVDNRGNFVSELLPVDDRGFYQGISPSGYHFITNAFGQIGYPLTSSYYLNGDCSGEVFVLGETARVYLFNQHELWYVDQHASDINISVNSVRDQQGECQPLENVALTLKRLQKDISGETGLTANRPLLLSVGYSQ